MDISARVQMTEASPKWEGYITQTERSLPPLEVLSAAIAKSRMGNASLAPKRRVPHAPTAISGIADGVRWSTADTL